MPRRRNNGNAAITQRGASKVYRNIRELLVNDATNSGSGALVVTTTSTGTAVVELVLSPFAIQLPQFTISGSSIVISQYALNRAYLPWLYATAQNFEQYRVIKATVIITGAVGSTATGRMIVDSSTDYADLLSSNVSSNFSGGRSTSVSSLSDSNFRVPIDVDTTWKRVSGFGSGQLASNLTNVLLTSSTVNDVSFSNVIVLVNGGPVSSNICNVSLEYDVEFKDPITSYANI